jgi:hypothetical protein
MEVKDRVEGAVATAYTICLHVDVARGMASWWCLLFDDDSQKVGMTEQVVVTTFCYTWQDLADQIERSMSACGHPGSKLSKPSPYIDLS